MRDRFRPEVVGKGGCRDIMEISPELHGLLRAWFVHNPGHLADLRGYQCAYARAIKAAGGHATGTHGSRRAAAQEDYDATSARYRGAGLPQARPRSGRRGT